MSALIIFLILLCIWAFVLYIVKRKGNDSFSMWGPILMWKTEKGKKLISRIARRERFWKAYADFGIVLSLIAMFATFVLILWNVRLTFKIAPENAPSPQMLIGLPGINPIIPVGYGILALAIAIIIHEFSHGILAMAGKIKVEALGLIFLIVPIGAFVEPDEEELEKVSRRKRSRVFAAGPTSNMVLAFVCALIFSSIMMGTLSPKVDGVMVTGEVPDSPFDVSGIKTWSAITSFNGSEIKNISDFGHAVENIKPGAYYNVTVFYKGKFFNESVLGGVVIAGVVDGYPASSAGLRRGDVLARLNGTEITNGSAFLHAINRTKAGEEIVLEYYRYENGTFEKYNTSAVLDDKYDYYEKYNSDGNKEEFKGKGFLGVTTIPLGISLLPVDYYPQKLAHPLSSMKSFFFYVALPFAGLSPFPKPLTAMFSTGIMPSSLFWPLANTFYWLFWLNFAIGTFNVLPAIPLDGGYIFKDGIGFVTRKIRKKMKEERVEKISSAVTTLFSVIVLLAIVAMLVIPRLRALSI
ncbi:MAG: PDZ domain-containing protein [Nitrospiraceae bacterium]|nr:PDZ domain-containing protein [Nitrospiraceae bacterium]